MCVVDGARQIREGGGQEREKWRASEIEMEERNGGRKSL